LKGEGFEFAISASLFWGEALGVLEVEMSEERGEFAYINWIRGQLPAKDGRVTVGIGDDMAEVLVPVTDRAAGEARLRGSSGGQARVLIGTDTILDGVHFDLAHDDLADVGWKALAVNLSDVAAMAAVPLAAVGAVALPRSLTMADARRLFDGLKRCAQEFDTSWVGGDITVWDHPLAVTVTVLAYAERCVLRSGARPGELVCVTGTLGGSLLGKHLTFQPRIREARRLAQTVQLGAMMDLSDGLSSDLNHLCDESGAGALIEAAKIPISEAAQQMGARDGRSPLDHALNDGEDFELLFTADAADAERLGKLDLGVPVTVVGRVVEPARGRLIVDERGLQRPLKPGGYEHWR
jgi:thiamine-monophosphate kinase